MEFDNTSESDVDMDTDDDQESYENKEASFVKKKRPPSKSIQRQCSVCKKFIVHQNFKSHMKTVHKSKETRAVGQSSLLQFFNDKENDKTPSLDNIQKENTSEKQEDEDINIQNEKNIENKEDEGINPLPKEKSLRTSNSEMLQNILKEVQEVKALVQNEAIAKENFPSTSDQNTVSQLQMDIKTLSHLKTISSVIETFPEFKKFDEEPVFVCRICHRVDIKMDETTTQGFIRYNPSDLTYNEIHGSFATQEKEYVVSREFVNIKKKLKRHIACKSHQKAILDEKEESRAFQIIRDKNLEIGIRCVRIIYRLVKSHRPYSEYEECVLTSVLNGCDMGEINHSEWFARQFTPFIAMEIRARLKKYLNTIQIQTGFRPPVNIIADKDTRKHRTRQIVMVMIIVPDSDELIQVIYLGHPIVKLHTGPDIAKSVTNITDEWIIKEQVVGASFDGQYHNLNVPNSLNEHFNLQKNDILYVWDPLHRAGLQDKHIRKMASHSYVVEVTTRIGSLFRFFNWGKNYELLADVALEYGIDLKDPLFQSETRFANYAYRLYQHMEQDYAICISTLEKIKLEKRNGSSEDRAKAREAEQLQQSIQNKKFAIVLCGLCDIYAKFSSLVNCLQKVNILPWQRLDTFNKCIVHMEEMVQNAKEESHENCIDIC